MPGSTALDSGVAHGVLWDEASYRTVRFAVAATIATLLGYGSGFELPYLVPVLASGFFAKPVPQLHLKAAVTLVAAITGASFFGVLLASLFLPYPYMFLLVAFLVLFRIFYAKAGGTSPIVIVFLLAATTIIPIVSLESLQLGVAIAQALAVGSALVVVSVILTHRLMPDLPHWNQIATTRNAEPASSQTPAERTGVALMSTAVVFPLFAAFFLLGWTSSILVLIFVAILSLAPSFAGGKTAGKALIAGNLLGGLGSAVFYNLLIVYPAFPVFLALTFLTALLYGRMVYSGRPSAPLFATGFNTVLLMVGMSVVIQGTEAMAKFYTRIVQIMIAVGYVVLIFGLLEVLFRQNRSAE